MALLRLPSRRAILRAGLAAAGAAVLPDVGQAADTELRFGLTPVFLTSDLELLARLKAYLERATERPVRLVTRRTYQEITTLLLTGQLDAAWICGYPFVAYRPELALVAVPVWKGRPLYQSYLIAAADRPASRLADLHGDAHAFSDPDSNSGWLVTAAELADMGTDPGRFFRQSFFTYGHRNVIRAVGAGLAMSGSVDGYVYEVMRETEVDLTAATRIVRASDWLGFPPVACSVALAKAPQTERLRRALAEMGDDADGRTVLAMLQLDGFNIEESSLFDPIAALMHKVKGAAG
ncbi:MAG: PhnD/SsuA/transferrin family substrate-binding protein [Xanthobacteraceae bacterium]|nr:PhnD/SsuA/transferrin family substrate-binding protein [Xanthobacteraceae bacterium]